MNTTRELALPVTGPELAEFILSLLGQRRTIERSYDVAVLFVRYEWVLNIVEIVNQRVSQNVSSMASFRCLYFFQNGMVKTVNSIKDFRAFHDNSHEQTAGIEIAITYLVEFPDVRIPEKQDIRLGNFLRTQGQDGFYSLRDRLHDLKTTAPCLNIRFILPM